MQKLESEISNIHFHLFCNYSLMIFLLKSVKEQTLVPISLLFNQTNNF